jgi:class 3 adenylate cyclase
MPSSWSSPATDHLLFVGDTDALVDEIEEFLTGARSGAEGDVLTMTVLFTDIVASTEHQARMGALQWSRLTTAMTPWCGRLSVVIGATR